MIANTSQSRAVVTSVPTGRAAAPSRGWYLPEFFRPVADLPNLGDAFHDRAMELIASGGKAAWTDAGGQPGAAGRLEFGEQSPVGAEIVAAIVEQHGGFQHVDEARVRWTYRVPAKYPDKSSALALYGNCVVDSIDRLIDRIRCKQLAKEFAGRNAFGERDTRRIKNRGRVADLLEEIRLWRRAPRLIPALYRGAVENGLGEFRLTREALAAQFFDASRRLPHDWESQLERALGVLHDMEIYRVTLSRTGWNPCVVELLPALPVLDCSGAEIRLRLAKEFVEFLEPCFPGVSVQSPPPSPAVRTKRTIPKTPRHAMEPGDEKQDRDAAQTAGQNNTNAKLQRQAQLVETALPAVHLATIAGKSLQQEVEVVGYLEYLNRLVAAAGNHQDPVVRMMVEQLAMANCRIGQLHANAACATSAQSEIAYTLAAAKLMSETRKTSLALQQYIAAANSKASGNVTVPTSPPGTSEPLPQPPGVVTPPAEKCEDTELTTNGSSRDHGKQTNAATKGSSPKPRTTKGPDPHRPRKAARNRNRLSALAVLNGSANGGGKGPFSG